MGDASHDGTRAQGKGHNDNAATAQETHQCIGMISCTGTRVSCCCCSDHPLSMLTFTPHLVSHIALAGGGVQGACVCRQ